jgi:nucleotide-binding universal stress UspA family protein
MGDTIPSFGFHRIMVPLDASLCSESALAPALAIARAMDAELVLFRVEEPVPRTRALLDMPDVYDEVVAAAYREAEEYLAGVKARLPYSKITTVHEPDEEGAAHQILEYCEAQGIDLIVFSSHGYSGVKRWTHGAVADKIVDGACCATLMVRCHPDEPAEND